MFYVFVLTCKISKNLRKSKNRKKICTNICNNQKSFLIFGVDKKSKNTSNKDLLWKTISTK